MLQTQLILIPHVHEGDVISQRSTDGYINATAMCKAAGKQFNDYARLKTAKEYLEALSTETGIPVSELIQSVKGGDPTLQGTWVHPDVATQLAQWLSPRFALQVSKWVREWLTQSWKSKQQTILPYHLERYLANRVRIPSDHFSILSELTTRLIAPLEDAGYTLPEELVPDISEGRMFCKWLRDEKGLDTASLPTYLHVYPDGRRVQAKLYPIDILPDFIRHFHDVWLPYKAVAYFKARDQEALTYLPKLLPGSRAA